MLWAFAGLFGGGAAGEGGTSRAPQPTAAPSSAASARGAPGDAGTNGADRASPPREAGPSAPPAPLFPWQPRPLAAVHTARLRAPSGAAAARSTPFEEGAHSAERASPPRGVGSAARDANPSLLPRLRVSPRRAPAAACGPGADAVAGAAALPRAGGLRTFAQMRQKRAASALPLGLPRGPWPTAKVALADINAFTSNLKTDGGGFAVVFGGSHKAATGRGERKKIICHEYKPPHVCKWMLYVEECVEGWVVDTVSVHSECATHSHELVQSREEANAHASMRSMPEDLLSTGKSMVSAGVKVCDVERWLRHQVKAAGGEVTFKYQDVYHATGASTVERALEATNFVEALRQR